MEDVNKTNFQYAYDQDRQHFYTKLLPKFYASACFQVFFSQTTSSGKMEINAGHNHLIR